MSGQMSFAEMVDLSTGPEGEALLDQMYPGRAQRFKDLCERMRNMTDEEFFAGLERIAAGNPYFEGMVAAYKKKKSQP